MPYQEVRIEIPVISDHAVAIVHDPKSYYFRVVATGYPQHIYKLMDNGLETLLGFKQETSGSFYVKNLEDKPAILERVRVALSQMDCLLHPENYKAPEPKRPPTQAEILAEQKPIENGIEIPVNFNAMAPRRRVSIEKVLDSGDIKIVMTGYHKQLAQKISSWIDGSLSRFIEPGNVSESNIPDPDGGDGDKIPVQTIQFSLKPGQNGADVAGTLYMLLLNRNKKTTGGILCGICAVGPCLRKCTYTNVSLFDRKAHDSARSEVANVERVFSGLDRPR